MYLENFCIWKYLYLYWEILEYIRKTFIYVLRYKTILTSLFVLFHAVFARNKLAPRRPLVAPPALDILIVGTVANSAQPEVIFIIGNLSKNVY